MGSKVIFLHLFTIVLLIVGCCLPLNSYAQQQEEERYKIQWHDHTLYTNQPAPDLRKSLTIETYRDTVEGYYFVQFTGPVTEKMKDQVVKAGAELFNYVPNYTYIVKMNNEERARVVELQSVQWVSVYQPALRLSQRVTNLIEGEEVQPPQHPVLEFEIPDTVSGEEDSKLQLTVLVFRGEDLQRVSEAVERAGGSVLLANKGEERSKLRVNISAENVYNLARINGVMWIEEYVLPRLHNDTARGVMNVTPVWNDHGLRGSGQIVGISDTGIDSGTNDATMHDDFEGPRIVDIFSWPVQPGTGASNTGADDGAVDLVSGHGTHVSGSVLGSGTVSGDTYTGVAPEASLVFQAIEQFTNFPGTANDGYLLTGIPADLNNLFQEAYNEGARIHTNSWGAPVGGAYNTNAQEVDQFVWNNPDMLILYSAGNSGVDADQNNIVDPGSIGSPGTAKNVLTVGASENNRPGIPQTYNSRYGQVLDTDQIADNTNGLAAFSSRGPTNDGRIKPDLVAPGTMVASVRSQSSPNTVWFTDDMEGGTAGWTAGGNWAQITTDANSPATSWHDSPGGNYGNNINSSLTSPTQNLAGGGLGSKAIQFWCRYNLGTGDQWFLEVSNDGGTNWGSIPAFTGNQANWELITVGLGAFSNAANLIVRFRIQSDNDGVTGDGLYIDDVRIVEGAFGSSLLSDHELAPAGSVNDQNYMLSNGTSMATPLTAGAAAIVRQYYTEEVGLSYVSAALLRATLMNGAAEMSPGQYGTGANQEIGNKPNNAEGWGLVDLKNSLFPPAPAVLDHVDGLAGLETGETHTYSLEITDNSVPVAITMVYHDFPGAGIINNLDMTVTSPGGTTLFPNGLATTEANNNVEQILVQAPQTGTYTIAVNGQNVPQGPQPYALVTSGGGTIAERSPVDVMLTLDLSGSMLSPACPTCDPKLDVLKDAVELFTQLWTAVSVTDERLGVTYFKTNISEFEIGGSVLLPVLANAAAIISDVQAQSTISTNLTAMGGGLQSSINRLTDVTRPRNIILFTDGMQNVNPMVQEDPSTSLIIDDEPGRTDSNVDPTSPPTVLDSDLGIKINTIGVGATPPFVDLLDNIASSTGGLSKLTTAPDDDLRRFYVEELVDVLRDNSPQLLAYRYGELTETAATETFTVNNRARKIVLKLSWKQGDKISFQVEKDSINLTRFGDVKDGPFYRIFSMELPADIHGTPVNAGGEWNMKIRGTQGVSYEAAAIVDEPSLKYDFSLGDEDYVAGDPLKLSVRLRFDGRPVTDADRVTATILRPGQGLGTLLSTSSMPEEPSGFQMESNATIGQKKLQLLLRDANFYKNLQPVTQSLTLQNNGDGSYSAEFPTTNMTGTYTGIFRVVGERPDIGKYKRTETLSTMVRFGAAEVEVSDLQVTTVEETSDEQHLLLRIRPMDRFGNYLGPDYGHRINVSLSAGSVGADKRDAADGSYEIPLVVSPGTDPVISVEVMGETVFDDRLSAIQKEPKFAISVHGGITIPVGNFGNAYDPGYLAEVDLEYRISSNLSVEAVVGRYNFDPEYEVTGGTLYLKGYLPLNGWRLFGAAGPGYYEPENTDGAFGISAGAGLNKPISPTLEADIGPYYFHLFSEGDDIDFLGLKAGLRFLF